VKNGEKISCFGYISGQNVFKNAVKNIQKAAKKRIPKLGELGYSFLK
jgi:hypothetical protein